MIKTTVNKLNMATSVILSGLLVLFPGCATILQPGPDMIAVNTTPEGATIHLDGEPVGKSPTTVTVHRASDAIFKIEKEGYKTVIIDRDKVLAGWFIPGNLLWLLIWPAFPIAMIVDLASSNQGKYKTNPINIQLEEELGAVTTRHFKVLRFYYNNDTNQGEISVETYGRGLECRNWLVENIGAICSSKRAILEAGVESGESGDYRILDEIIENNVLTVHFEQPGNENADKPDR